LARVRTDDLCKEARAQARVLVATKDIVGAAFKKDETQAVTKSFEQRYEAKSQELAKS
jgi:hypothetical protein